MRQPTPEQREQLSRIARNYPHVLTWIEEWYNHELKQLPMVTANVALAQGRCLVLGELIKQLTAPLTPPSQPAGKVEFQ
jgi:hypothetical protein